MNYPRQKLLLKFETVFKQSATILDKDLSCEECDEVCDTSGPCVDCYDCDYNCEECESDPS